MGTMFSYRIKSKFDLIQSVEKSILQQATQAGFNDDTCFALRLAMDEAMINAIIHGNQYQEEKEISVTAKIEDDKIWVSVEDEGPGFDLTQLVDPREEPFLHKTNGRGVFLIKQFTSDVYFNETGNQITFIVDQNNPAPILQMG